MEVTARPAVLGDMPELVRLYERLEEEMVALKPIWARADGLPVPVDEAWRERIADETSTVLLGTLDGAPVGFLLGSIEPLLPQAAGAQVASVRLIFTEPEAREIGVGEALISSYLERARGAGVALFDAHVPPGHRNAKNFFESHGFSARRIVMHRSDERP